jgi:hypothetical protein
MELRHYDSNGNIDYDAIRADAAVLRREAIDAFFRGLANAVVAIEAGLARRVRHALVWHSPKVAPTR